jgi:pSer/pThr/pTyr-binding forkhead associated (FHA) protein
MPEAVVVVREGVLAGTRFEIDSELVIGRENAGLTIADDEISRRHAVVRLGGEQLEIEDLESLNGTFVNGTRIETVTALASGDTIRIGNSTLEVESVPEPASDRTVLSTPVVEAQPTAQQVRPAEPAPPVQASPPRAPEAPLPVPAVPAFAAGPATRRRGVATRRITPAALTVAVIVATAVALVLYFAMR